MGGGSSVNNQGSMVGDIPIPGFDRSQGELNFPFRTDQYSIEFLESGVIPWACPSILASRHNNLSKIKRFNDNTENVGQFEIKIP
jgi:hypothetical protein